MSNKQNVIELVTEVKDDKVITKKYYTPRFLSMKVIYSALELNMELSEVNAKNERDLIDKLANFVANEIYGGQFTKEELENGLHAPAAVEELQEQLLFAMRGYQSDERKKLVEKKD